MSKRVLAVQDLLHLSCVIATRWIARIFQAIFEEVLYHADDIVYLSREASMENLQHLQRYSEKLQFKATCVRLWANGIHVQIMDEQEKVQKWILGTTDEIN